MDLLLYEVVISFDQFFCLWRQRQKKKKSNFLLLLPRCSLNLIMNEHFRGVVYVKHIGDAASEARLACLEEQYGTSG